MRTVEERGLADTDHDIAISTSIDRELTTLLAGGRVLLLTLAHPLIADSLAANPSGLEDPFRRLLATTQAAYTLAFGTDDEVDQLSAHLERVHRGIGGPGWSATDADLYWYTLAVLHDSGVTAFEACVRPLESAELEAHYASTVTSARRLGIDASAIPATWVDCRASLEKTYATTHVNEAARGFMPQILNARSLGLLKPAAWAWRRMAVWLLPDPIRTQYGLELTPDELRAIERFAAASRLAHKRLPEQVWEIGFRTFSGTDYLYAPSSERDQKVSSWRIVARAIQRGVVTRRRRASA